MNYERYIANKLKAVHNNTEPTETDQSQARDTDINVIIGRFGIGHMAKGNGKVEMYEDFTDLPRDLRGYIEQARGLDTLRERLPEQLKTHKLDELLQLTPQQIHGLLFPQTPANRPEPQQE
jgi:hypothetical protein